MDNRPASEQIDDIISSYEGWKHDLLTHLRTVITQTDSRIKEEVKWKMATRPAGLPVWSCNGIVCFAEIWKDNIKLIFFKGAQLEDHNKLFNARLKSGSVRAIEFREGDTIDESPIQALVVEAVKLNSSKA